MLFPPYFRLLVYAGMGVRASGYIEEIKFFLLVLTKGPKNL